MTAKPTLPPDLRQRLAALDVRCAQLRQHAGTLRKAVERYQQSHPQAATRASAMLARVDQLEAHSHFLHEERMLLRLEVHHQFDCQDETA